MFKWIEDKIQRQLIKWVNEALKVLKEDIDSKTPEDTTRLLKANDIVDAQVNWNAIEWAVKNETEYARFVEYGVGGKAYNYHKPKWSVFYKWVGARMFTRAYDEKKKQITQIIQNSIKL
jgi:hypothetical protein